jgi:hypothetical protein
MTIISVGYPDENTKRPKKSLSEVLEWESFYE